MFERTVVKASPEQLCRFGLTHFADSDYVSAVPA